MELKWTSKALSDLARLYDFLVLASKPAAARTVQSLTQAPVILLGGRLENGNFPTLRELS